MSHTPDEKPGEILFYAKDRKAFPWLSNFWMVPGGIEMEDGRRWPSLEHYYQAQKFSNLEIQYNIRVCPRPGDAKRLARLHKEQIRKDWDAYRIPVMLRALRRKFAVPGLRRLLLETGDARLIEDSPFDAFWGIGRDGTGQNWLGRCLMQVREELKRTPAP